MRAPCSSCWACVDHGLNMYPPLNRIGAGAFDYDFGALDDVDNPLTKSYTNVMCDCLRFGIRVPAVLTICHVTSYACFGIPSQLLLFFMAVIGLFPGLLTWLCDNSSDPGMQRLRQNKDEAHKVARKLLDSKRQELKAGTPRKDLMSLLGLSLSFGVSDHAVVHDLYASQS